jgi:RNA polymerase sigma factor (sigma-70 family)
MNDWELVRQYVESNSQAAFARLMDRHLAMVYWTCRRDVESHETAEDATQAVFLLLARKARGFDRGVSVASWLFRASRFVAQDARKREARRRRTEERTARDRVDAALEDQDVPESVPWLNDGLSALADADRQAILLRYFGGLGFDEIAAELRTTEETARKRVSRAVERLRTFLIRQHSAVTTITLAGLLTAQSARTAPPTLAAGIVAAIQQPAGSAAAAHPVLLQKGLHLAMATTRQKVIASAAALCAAMLIAVPILRADDGATEQGAFVNNAPPQPATDPTAAARAEIIGDYRNMVVGLGKGPGGSTYQSPHIVVALAIQGKTMIVYHADTGLPKPLPSPAPATSTQPGQSLSFNEVDGVALPGGTDRYRSYTTTLTLTALTITGPEASAATQAHFAGVRQDTDGRHTITFDMVSHDHWILDGGHWSIDRNNSDITSGVIDGVEEGDTLRSAVPPVPGP